MSGEGPLEVQPGWLMVSRDPCNYPIRDLGCKLGHIVSAVPTLGTGGRKGSWKGRGRGVSHPHNAHTCKYTNAETRTHVRCTTHM